MEVIFTDGTRFVDEYSRERIFNGVNIVDKRAYENGNEHFPVEFSEELFHKFKKRGINIIRLGFTWSLIEPEPGKYNAPYLDSVEDILDKCALHDVYVFLDMHQDLYSAFDIGLGDGAPLWACLNGEIKPKPIKFAWDEGYWWGKAVQTAFDAFWANRTYNGKGLLDWYADCWRHIAGRFCNKKAFFGYDFINEPFPGTDGGKIFRKMFAKLIRVILVDRNISRRKLLGDAIHKSRRVLLYNHFNKKVFSKIVSAGTSLVGKFDVERYSPFLNKMSSAVREISDNGIVFADNCYYSNLGI